MTKIFFNGNDIFLSLNLYFYNCSNEKSVKEKNSWIFLTGAGFYVQEWIVNVSVRKIPASLILTYIIRYKNRKLFKKFRIPKSKQIVHFCIFFICSFIFFYFFLPISRERIVFGSNFRNGDFDGFTRFEVLWIRKSYF